MKNIIEIIGEKILNELFDFDNNSYNVEKTDPNHPEVYDTTEVSMSFNGDMNKRYFKFAREAAMKASYKGTRCAPKFGIVAVYKGSINCEACNTN